VIFGIQLARDGLTNGAASKGSELPFYLQPNTRNGICGNLPVGKGGGTIRVHPWFYDLYATGDYAKSGVVDYRTDFSFLTRWNGSTNATPSLARRYVTYPVIEPDAADLVREQQPYVDKYKDPGGKDSRNHENDFYIIRLAEVFLIKAEALNELGRTSEASEPFNKLRQRARLANGTARAVPIDLAPGLSKADFRLAIYNERGLELLAEGQRWFDGTRMRYLNTDKSMLQWRYDTFYPSLASTVKVLPSWNVSGRFWTAGRAQPINIITWNDRYKLFPIPSNELDANPNFGVQNPGW
jgi:starch-binding outer membrane protein, SusD/RagB family